MNILSHVNYMNISFTRLQSFITFLNSKGSFTSYNAKMKNRKSKNDKSRLLTSFLSSMKSVISFWTETKYKRDDWNGERTSSFIFLFFHSYWILLYFTSLCRWWSISYFLGTDLIFRLTEQIVVFLTLILIVTEKQYI